MNEPDPGAHSIDRWGYFTYSKELDERTIDAFFSEALKRDFVHKDIKDAYVAYKAQRESLTKALDARLKAEFGDDITIEKLEEEYKQRN